MNFWRSFRVKLLLVLAALLIVTLALQYYLNSKAEQHNLQHRTQRQKTLVAGIALGINSLSSRERLSELKDKQPFSQEYLERIANILVIDNEWQVYDSLNPELLPKDNENYLKLTDLRDLPPLSNSGQLGSDRNKFPNADVDKPNTKNGESHAIPVQTDDGQWYVMIVLKPEEREPFFHAAQPLTYVLFVLLTAMLVTIFIVSRFTRPVSDLSDAAQRIAEGDLSTRVPTIKTRDEMGRLIESFNEMAKTLEKTRELEIEVRQAEKLAVIGRLVSSIAHEIRNPLNYINLTLDQLRAKFAPKEERERETFDRLTEQLKTEVARINRQITDLLRYSRPLKLNLQLTAINEVIEDSMRLVERQAAEQSVTISFTKGENILQIFGDVDYLRSVFNNLLINAVQAMPHGGKLSVVIERESDFVVIEITDTGNGIPPENLDKVFEPYFSTKDTGTGLGLAIVKKVVDDHNGIITVSSVPDKGTVFTVKLPFLHDKTHLKITRE